MHGSVAREPSLERRKLSADVAASECTPARQAQGSAELEPQECTAAQAGMRLSLAPGGQLLGEANADMTTSPTSEPGSAYSRATLSTTPLSGSMSVRPSASLPTRYEQCFFRRHFLNFARSGTRMLATNTATHLLSPGPGWFAGQRRRGPGLMCGRSGPTALHLLGAPAHSRHTAIGRCSAMTAPSCGGCGLCMRMPFASECLMIRVAIQASMLSGAQVSFSQTLCAGGQLLTPSLVAAQQCDTLPDALSPMQPLVPPTAACTVSLVACGRTSAAKQPQHGQLPLQLWAGANVQRSSGARAQPADAPGKCDGPGGGRAAGEAENAGGAAARGAQGGPGEGPPLLRDLVRRLTYERPSVLDGVTPFSTAVCAHSYTAAAA